MASLLKDKIFVIILTMIFTVCNAQQQNNMHQKDSLEHRNKIVPEKIWRETYVALSYYPELKETPIEFKFKKNIKKSFMQAQPRFSGFFKNRKKRSYVIYINEKFKIEDETFSVTDVPSDVLIGWLGHELGHVMDYRDRSALDMLWFGVKYVTSKNYIREAERMADTYAVNHGLGENIIATKDFILNHSKLSESYKSRIQDLYLSQEEIMVLIEQIHKEVD